MNRSLTNRSETAIQIEVSVSIITFNQRHVTAFLKRSLLERLRSYDEVFKMCSDLCCVLDELVSSLFLRFCV